ncbi:hypothetical protein ACN28S_67335, partial [Cystobacter fuscus]
MWKACSLAGASRPSRTACCTAQPGSRSCRQSLKRQWGASSRMSTKASRRPSSLSSTPELAHAG